MSEYMKALKLIAAPIASITVVAGTILWFAADAWIRNIVTEEVASIQTGTTNAASQLQAHAQTLEKHDEEIDKNDETIEKVDDKFTEFVREVISKL